MRLFSSKPTKPKPQFSQQMCTRSWRLMALMAAACLGGEFALQYTGRGSMTAIVIVVEALITLTTIFINGGYITQNVFRDTSLNKHGIHLDGHDKHYIEKSEENKNAD